MTEASEGATAVQNEKTWFGHPRGLTVLFLTQTWAEFSYFGLQALLVYYMTRQLGFDQVTSSLVYGTYGAAAFFSPFIGGMIADRWLGRTPSVVIGGLLMMTGHFALAFEMLLFPALALVAIGNGLFLPPLAVQVGSLYRPGDPRQAQAFTSYYMGINLGALLAPLICGTLGELYGWHWGFGAAGVGMAGGLLLYLSGRRYLPPEPVRQSAAERGVRPGLLVEERRAIKTLIVMVAVIILFRVGYEQSGNVIALWVADHTDRSVTMFGSRYEIPATWFQSINPFLIIAGSPLLMIWYNRRARTIATPNLFHRMAVGCAIAGLAMVVMVFAAAQWQIQESQPVSLWWVTGYLILLTLGELMVLPVGLTMVDRLSPARMAAMCMGAWYIAKFIGSLLAGVMGAWWGRVPATLFFSAGVSALLLATFAFYLLGRSGAQSIRARSAALETP